MKKFLSVFLCLCLTVSLLAGTAFASGEASPETTSAQETLVLTDPAWELSADGTYSLSYFGLTNPAT
jgi:hypothetical protein